MSRRRVVVTGLGTVNPLGLNVADTWKNAQAGTSGVGRISRFDPSDFKAQIAAEVTGFDPEHYMPLKEARRLDRNAQFFWAASEQAMNDAGLSFEEDDPQALRAGVACGSGIGGIITFQDEVGVLLDRGPSRVSPLAITKIISNMAGGVASIQFNLFGPNICTVTACAASANAIGDAAEIIRRDDADVMLAGGTEAGIVELSLASFASARALSTRNDDPAAASRPFDADRDGFVMGEGAAVLILEERERAIARDATIYGEVLGYGMSADGYHITMPRPGGAGATRAMQHALRDAALDASEIDYVNAHGTSTPANDSTETAAIKAAFGEHAADIPVSSTKSMSGHLLGGAGALEALLCILAIRDGVLPPTINYETPDPECDLDYVPNEARDAVISHVMSNSFGFGGHNVSLIFGGA
ncbi:MAG: beta-ketoacyl-ACP synthase II [Acidimicrobiia bacterium]|nr:beta-ketoacyl-ACP synthase II [Acidimicrobiia bacterium]